MPYLLKDAWVFLQCDFCFSLSTSLTNCSYFSFLKEQDSCSQNVCLVTFSHLLVQVQVDKKRFIADKTPSPSSSSVRVLLLLTGNRLHARAYIQTAHWLPANQRTFIRTHTCRFYCMQCAVSPFALYLLTKGSKALSTEEALCTARR